MIPWVREKFAERRAKWVAARKRSEKDSSNGAAGTSTNSTVDSNSIQSTTQSSEFCNTASRSTNINGNRLTSMTNALTIAEKINKSARLKRSRQSVFSDGSQGGSPTCSSVEQTSKPKEKIKIRVVTPSSRLLSFQTDAHKTLLELKQEVLLELSDDCTALPYFATDVRQLVPRFRLIKSESCGMSLNENFSLVANNIADNDTLVLLSRRSTVNQTLSLQDMHAPTSQEIERATQNMKPAGLEENVVDINEIFQQTNLQFDVRKVLISLAQTSAVIIGSGPYANRLISMLKQRLVNKRNHHNDTLQCLVDMGFTKEKASYAVKLHNGVYTAALEYLIQHQSDETLSNNEAGGIMSKSQSTISASSANTPHNILENTQALLEIVRIYSHREIPPTIEAINSLIEMGFAELDVLKALKKTCNNRAAACEWLCGNRSDSLIELRDGLSKQSTILRTILELPQVQISLNNPKILLAFLSILENENAIRVWGGDNDTTSVITHILQKYHEEKHVLGINQFYNTR